jgi:hypothetical protein
MKRSLKDLTAAAADHFSYLIVYAPEFPKEDQTDADCECGRLLEMLREIEARAAETPKKQWLRLTIKETEDARERFRAEDAGGANDMLHSAEEHFKAYLSGKRERGSFIAGPDGTIERVDD